MAGALFVALFGGEAAWAQKDRRHPQNVLARQPGEASAGWELGIHKIA
jgi:hypothetical protein